MRMRDGVRVFSWFFLVGVIVLAAASCGSAGHSGGAPFDASVGDEPIGTFNGDDGGSIVSSCIPQTCADQGFDCGMNSNGCGTLIDCGSCDDGEKCGYGGRSKCGDPLLAPDGGPTCTPKACADFGYDCGLAGDGCGNMIDCGPVACTGTEFCGGGGPNKCGGDFTKTVDGAPPCTPATCASLGFTCGLAGDGCGGMIGPCTPGCTNPQTCGGAGAGNECGGNDGKAPDGGSTLPKCVPATCASLGYTCGQAGDGCGGVLTCTPGCTNPQFCGGGGTNKCGGNDGRGADGGISCKPLTCANYPASACGPQSDGCGGLTLNCGTCKNPAFCGGGGAGLCGGNNTVGADGGTVSSCVPATCNSLGFNCGEASDGCGNVLDCGGTTACVAPQACGGGGKPNVCGSSEPCTNLCKQKVTCDAGFTTLSGTVVAGTPSQYLPSGVTVGDPVPNVLVYVPNSTPSAFLPRAQEDAAQQCSTCGADVSGDPLVTAYTGYNGQFQLSDVPVGASIPIVIQLGRWRRQFTVSVTGCANNVVHVTGLPAGYLVMPHNQQEGDIPLTALDTGNVDAMECVLLKMGIDQSEFTQYTGGGRVHVYQGNGAVAGANTPGEATLMGQAGAFPNPALPGTYNQYDQIILPCWGVDPVNNDSSRKTTTELGNLVSYANAGGHFFATHYSYAWLTQPWGANNGPFVATANWNVDANQNIASVNGTVSTAVPPTSAGTFVNWLNYVQALNGSTTNPPAPNPATVALSTVRHDVDSVAGNSVEWIEGTDPKLNTNMLMHFTFDTPVGQPNQCGHAIFSDFHVTNQNATNGFDLTSASDIVTECGNTPMIPQEKILEYMIWDLASCVPPVQSLPCTKKTCSSYPSGTCGEQSDGCGGLTTNCGSCAAGTTCGGGGVANVCGAPDGGACTKLTCSSAKAGTCGPISDGCGGVTAYCNACPAGETCGGGGVPGQCGAPDGGACTPKTCAAYTSCGVQSDGCGGLTANCNPCPAGQTCGGGGVNGKCGAPPISVCTPKTCAELPAGTCGVQSDGCGGLTADCNACPTGQTCGGGGVANVCGNTSQDCPKITCADQGIACGPAADGCGGLIASCGTCVPPATCGGGGVLGQCGGNTGCVPQTCQDLGIECGQAGDGCGGVTANCGTCTAPATCGGGGVAGQCGISMAR